jgi:hypothetical protein
MKKKVLFVLVATIGLTAAFVSCKEDTNDGLTSIITNYTECSDAQKKVVLEPSMTYNVIGNTLFINRENIWRNCFTDSITISSNIQNGVLNIQEIEPINVYNCICQRNLSYNISNIPQGNFTVIIQPGFDTLYIHIP